MPRRPLAIALPLLLALSLAAATPAFAAKRALFDNFHAEQAGNADWVIDDNAPTPAPAQGAIVASTPRTYWQGAISSWGVDLVKRGFTVTTNNAAISYGNGANPLDLSNFDVFIVPEPNTLFSAAEKTAILNFVRDGGGLIAVGDHDISDRNNDGFDSPKIWNDLDPTFLLGVHWGSTGDANSNIVQTSSNVNAAPSDSVTRGPEGNVAALAFHNGTTFTLHPEANPSVRGEVWMTAASQAGLTGVMAASSRYGSGRVFFCGDSSPIDDGSANPGNTNIFDGWAEVADSVLFMNATLWATRRAAPAGDLTAPTVAVSSPNGGEDWKAGSSHAITWTASDNVAVTAIDLAWSSDGGASYPNVIASSLANSGTFSWVVADAPGTSVRVRVTARDAASNSAADASDANLAISRFTVSATAGAGGSVSPAGTTSVAQGANVLISVTPDPNFQISAVAIDGVPSGAPASVSFTNITANHTLAATFRDAAAPVVSVTAPLGGETWDLGTSHVITWTASDNTGVDSIRIEHSSTGIAGPWSPLANGLTNSGSFNWTVTGTPTDSAYVRVTAFDPTLNATTVRCQAPFTLRDATTGVGGRPTALRLSPPWPNPARDGVRLGFALPAAARVQLSVHEVTGRVVWSRAESLASGGYDWRWNGRDASGRAVGAGLYLVRLVTPMGTRSARLAWVR